MPTRARSAAPALLAIAALLMLAGCAPSTPGSSTSTRSGGPSGGTPSPVATRVPDLSELRLDADGLVGPDRDHSLRMGRPVPDAGSTAVASWDADACAGGAAQPGDPYSGAWSAAYPSAAGFYGGADTAPFQLDSSGTRQGDIDWIVVLGTGVATTRGVRVGDPVLAVSTAYSSPAGIVHLGLSDLWVIAGTVGQLVIEVTVDDGSGYWQPDQVGRVFALSTRPLGSEPAGLVATDDVPGCKA